MSDILKPCPNPWCAGDLLIRWELYKRQVFCTCGVKGPLGADDSEAITAWNTRPAPKVKPLVWDVDGRGVHVSTSVFGSYEVYFDDGWRAELESGLAWEWESENCHAQNAEILGLMACDEHHAARILSALEGE